MKYCKEKEAGPLQYIFNFAIQIGKFPSLLKTSVVTPLYKTDDKLEPKNYRPVALNSPFSKAFEKMLLTRVESFFIKHSIIATNQFGYQKKKKDFTKSW